MNTLLLPVAMMQGRRFMATTTMAPVAAGHPSGSVGVGDDPPLRLTVVGDSTAVGHGVERQDDGVAAQLARMLADRMHRPVSWTAIGQFGATTRRIRHQLVPTMAGPCDVAVLLAGGNDVLSRRPLPESRADYAAILDALTARAGRVVAFGIPPFRSFHALPWALSRYLSARGDRFDSMAYRLCRERGVHWISASAALDASFFASDGFHPSATGYRLIAASIAEGLA